MLKIHIHDDHLGEKKFNELGNNDLKELLEKLNKVTKQKWIITCEEVEFQKFFGKNIQINYSLLKHIEGVEYEPVELVRLNSRFMHLTSSPSDICNWINGYLIGRKR